MNKPDYFYEHNNIEDVTQIYPDMIPLQVNLDIFVVSAVNLYHVIETSEMLELYKYYTGRNVTSELLYELLLPMVFEEENYFFYDNLIVNYEYLGYRSSFLSLHKRQQGFSRYVPSDLEDFVNYYDPYYSDNYVVNDLFQLLLPMCGYDEDNAATLSWDFMDHAQQITNLEIVMQELLDSDLIVRPLTEKFLNDFLDIYYKALNEERRPFLNGWRFTDLTEEDYETMKQLAQEIEEENSPFLEEEYLEDFARLWLSLLTYVNSSLDILPEEEFYELLFDDKGYTSLIYIRDILWQRPEFILEFIEEYEIENSDKEVYESWYHHHLKGLFIVGEHRDNYSAIIGSSPEKVDRVYAVRNFITPLEEILPEPYTPFETVLLPFKGRIVYDTFIHKIQPDEKLEEMINNNKEQFEFLVQKASIRTRLDY